MRRLPVPTDGMVVQECVAQVLLVLQQVMHHMAVHEEFWIVHSEVLGPM